jgi:bacterioferritin
MASQLRDDLVFERATIGLYDEIIRTCSFNDSVTRRLFESLLADENEHAEELSSFLFELDASTGQQIESTEKTEMKRRAA